MICLFFLFFLFFLYKTYHVNRNKYNVLPVGRLTLIKHNKYRDENGILWIKRGFFKSVFHNPFKYYVFETYDTQTPSSSEVKILKSHFDAKQMTFQPSSFNYYSSFRFPVQHFFADVLPIFIFFNTNL
jgi:hypothetical protein